MTTEEDLRRLAALRHEGELSAEEYEQAAALARAESPWAPPAFDGQPARQTLTQPSFASRVTPAAPMASFASAPQPRSWIAQNPWSVAVPILLVIGLIWNNSVGAPQRALEELAADTCEQLDNAIVLQVGYILGDAIDDASDLGFTAPELGDEMRATCPAMMDAIDDLSSEY